MGFSIYIGLCCLGILITNPFLGAKGASCPTDWLQREGNCYGYFDDHLDWDAAELECQSHGPGCHLASVLSRHEASILSLYMKDKQQSLSSVWIGLFDISGKGRWRWTDESTFNYRNWLPKQPDNKDEHCVEVTYSSDFKHWNDRLCNSLNAFICKYRL